jgi:VWFA-related protein
VFVKRLSFASLTTGLLTCLPLGLLGVLLVFFQPAQGQPQNGKEAQKKQDEVVTLKSHLVTLDVLVKDNKGKYITDIKAEDFTVFENGVRQIVDFFDPPLALGERNQPNADPKGPVKPGGKPINILSLILDGATTDLANMREVRDGILKYIREQVTENDTVAVFGVSTDLQVLQPFTQDKQKLIAAVENAHLLTVSNKNLEQTHLAEDIERTRSELAGGSGNTSLPASPAAAAQGPAAAQAMLAARALEQFIKLRSQLSVQQARPVLAALAAICEAQRAIPGKKTLVVFSQGFVAPTILDWQVQSVIDIANRANVAIYIIDSAGLRTSGPLSTSPVPDSPLSGVSAINSTESRMRASGGENMFDNVRHEGLNRQYDILYRISGDTGGEFIKGTNDIAKPLRRIDQDIRSRYTLAYYATDQNFDGSLRKIKVDVSRPDARVISRSGYYANAGDDLVPLSPDEKKLLANLAEIEAHPALPLFVELSPFRARENRFIVPLSIEVPPNAVKFEQKGDKQHVQFEVFGVIRESSDRIIARLGGGFDIALTAEQYRAILSNNIFYRQDAELDPGTYSIEFIVRDRLSGKMAGRKTTLVLPAASVEFSTSAVVLSRHAVPANNPPGASGPVDVLSEGKVQIRPFPSREFRATDNLIIFFDLYNAAVNPDTGKALVRVTVKLMKDSKQAMRPIDYVLTETVTRQVRCLSFAKYISLAGLTTGKYVAVIETLDMVTRKLITQQAPFVIRP